MGGPVEGRGRCGDPSGSPARVGTHHKISIEAGSAVGGSDGGHHRLVPQFVPVEKACQSPSLTERRLVECESAAQKTGDKREYTYSCSDTVGRLHGTRRWRPGYLSG